MRLGILGGTFNPIHLGHLILAECAREKLDLEKVLFVPANIPPHKNIESLIDVQKRLNMVELSIKGNPHFEASKIELERGGTSYTVSSLREFRKIYGEKTELFFLIGSDSLAELSSWRQIDEILKLAQLAVAERPGHPLKGMPEGALPLDIPCLDVSSSEIRRRIRGGETVRYLVADSVIDFIQKEGLYKNEI